MGSETKRYASILIFAVLTPLVAAVIIGSLWWAFSFIPTPKEQHARYEQQRLQTIEHDGGSITHANGETLITTHHDGHAFVIHDNGRGSSMIHHPGCDCLEATK